VGSTPPNGVMAACVLGQAAPDGCGLPALPPATQDRIQLYNWTAPNAANVQYWVGHRATGSGHLESGNTPVGQSPDKETKIVVDSEELPTIPFTWWVRAKLLEGGEGYPTNDVTRTPVNAPPVPVNDSGYVAHWNIPLPITNALANDTDADSPATTQRYCGIPPLNAANLVTARMCAVLANGTLSGPTLNGGTVTVSADGQTFNYTPPRNYKGPDSFTYKVFGGYWKSSPDLTNPVSMSGGNSTGTATVSITVVKP